MKINRIDHLAIAVPDLDKAIPFFTDVLGLEVTHTDVEEGQGVVVAFMPLGESEIELIEPVEETSGVARFLDRRGSGMHHLCVEVDDMDEALARLQEHEVRLIDDEPYIGTGGRRIVFIHPKAAHGVLVELYEKLPGDNQRRARVPRIQNLDELRQSIDSRRETLRDVRSRALARGRVAAAGTRGFLGSLRRSRDAEDGLDASQNGDATAAVAPGDLSVDERDGPEI